MGLHSMHGRIHNTWSNRVESNPPIGVSDRQCSRDRFQAALAEVCETCWQVGDGLTYQRCGDVDDVSEFLKTHSRDRELRHEKEPKQIRRESDSKVFRCVLREWFRKKNARIVHQQIDGPKVLDGSSHDP